MDVPEPVHKEAAILQCPEDDCWWFEAVAYEDVPEGESLDTYPRYVAHWLAHHGSLSVLGRVEPGSIVRLGEAVDDVVLPHLLEELGRLAGGRVLVVDGPLDQLQVLDPALLAGYGWIRDPEFVPREGWVGVPEKFPEEDAPWVGPGDAEPIDVAVCPECGQTGHYDGRVLVGGRGVYRCPDGHRWQNADEKPSDKAAPLVPRTDTNGGGDGR